MVLAEASGVVRRDNELLIVGDGSPGVYFRYEMTGLPGESIAIAQADPRPIAGGDVALDLESIDVLADGRVVALSEQLRALIGEDGLVADYPDAFGAFAGKGLEGLAVRPDKDSKDRSKVAVLWEGGFPEAANAPASLWCAVAGRYMSPVVLVHEVAAGASGLRFKGDHPQPFETVTLRPPLPARSPDGTARFRASDLVWHRVRYHGDEKWGFIVLLNAEAGSDQVALQRFAKDGTPVGAPLDLTEMLPEPLRWLKWEGLGWFEPGKSLVLVHDSKAGTPLTAAIVRCPKDW